MKTQSPDTHPEIERIIVEAARKMTFAERFHKIEDLMRTAQALALADINHRYPNATEHEIRMRLGSRRIPADLMRKAFGWDPDVEGY